MKDHPLLYSPLMVHAVLDDRKTQTRRILTPRNTLFDGGPWTALAKRQGWNWDAAFVDQGPSPAGNPGPYLHLPWQTGDKDPFDGTVHRIYPRIQRGDRIWGKETFSYCEACTAINYRASVNTPCNCAACDAHIARWRPSIFLRRQDARIAQAVTRVRIERLQDISEEDAHAEGVYRGKASGRFADNYSTMAIIGHWFSSARAWYRDLWIRINGEGSWEENPWVLVYDLSKHGEVAP